MIKSTPFFCALALLLCSSTPIAAQDFYSSSIQEVRLELPAKNWDTKLPEDLFIQIHRSTIVNLHNVAKIEKWANDTGRLYLEGVEKPFEISRNYFFQIKKKYKM